MKQIIIIHIALLFFSFFSFAEETFYIHTQNNETNKFTINEIDNNKTNEDILPINIYSPISDIKENTFKIEENIDINKLDKQSDGNILKSVSFLSSCNKDVIITDIKATLDGNTFTAFIPYLTDFSNLAASFESTGKVYVEQNFQQSGKTRNNYSNQLTYKIISSEGDVRTYFVRIINTGLPVLTINTTNTNNDINHIWENECSINIRYSDNKLNYTGKTSIKCRSCKYSDIEKKSYNLKLNKKSQLLDMTNGKRWELFSNYSDNSLIRTISVFNMANSNTSMSWNPTGTAVELIINGKHEGTYFLCEQIRISNDRVNDGTILEITNDIENDDVTFKANISETIFRIVDPDIEAGSNKLTALKLLVDNFETALYKSDINNENSEYKNYIDINSFADWFLINEIGKNTDAAFISDCYLNITSDNKLKMGPIWNFEKYLGNGDSSYEGFAIKDKVWMKQLFKDNTFTSLVNEKMKEIYNSKNSILQNIKKSSEELEFSILANEELWNRLNLSGKSDSEKLSAYHKEIEKLQAWTSNRLEWLKTALEIENKLSVRDKLSNQNQMTSFGFKLSDNNKNKILSNYSAIITEDSIALYIPYLVDFDLTANFETTGKDVYVNGIKQESGKSIVNFKDIVEYKVVSLNGEIRTYKVNIHNSGLPVIYIETNNQTPITSKTEWIEKNSMTVYDKDGKINYATGNDLMSIRGRGNSTWDASNKKPYAVKLNKKEKILKMPEHKRWVLLANHYDRSFIRAGLASWLGKKYTNQDWTPSGFSVELVLNGSHVGNYFFCEQIKLDENRVIGQYLLEVDTKTKTTGSSADDILFNSKITDNVFNIKDPEIETNGTEYNYIRDAINNIESILYDDNKFLDPNEGYKKYIDLESFVDWSLIKELSKDYDGNFFTSCQMHFTENGILKMGPLWDFDLAFANNPFAEMFGGFGGNDYAKYNEPEGFHVLTADWLNRMMLDPEFIRLMRQKIDILIENENEIMQYIDEQAAPNINSFIVNETMWKTLGSSNFWGGSNWNYTEESLRESYNADIAKMKKFILERLAWMKTELEKY